MAGCHTCAPRAIETIGLTLRMQLKQQSTTAKNNRKEQQQNKAECWSRACAVTNATAVRSEIQNMHASGFDADQRDPKSLAPAHPDFLDQSLAPNATVGSMPQRIRHPASGLGCMQGSTLQAA